LPKDFTLDQYRNFILDLRRRLPPDIYPAENNSWNGHLTESYMRALGKSYYTREGTGLGFTRQDLINWFTWWEDLRKAGCIPSAELTAELDLVPYVQTLFAQGKSAMFIGQANQLTPFVDVTPGEIVAGRIPRVTMDRPGDFFQPTMFSISSRSRLADQSADFINWMVNDVGGNVTFSVDNYGVPGDPDAFRALMNRATAKELINYQICDYILQDTRVPPTSARVENSVTVMETYMRRAYEDIATGAVSMNDGVDRFFREASEILSRNTPNR
jgi:multiple sugar transport system substrate-binding protein